MMTLTMNDTITLCLSREEAVFLWASLHMGVVHHSRDLVLSADAIAWCETLLVALRPMFFTPGHEEP